MSARVSFILSQILNKTIGYSIAKTSILQSNINMPVPFAKVSKTTSFFMWEGRAFSIQKVGKANKNRRHPYA